MYVSFLFAVFEDTALSRGVRTVTVAEGRPVVLRCSHYVSVPRATVTWYSVNTTSRDHWSIVDQTPVNSDERIAVDDRGLFYNFHGVGRAFIGVCLSVCLSVCLFARALKGKRPELPTPNLVRVYSIAVARHALTQRSKGQRSKSHGYENRHGRAFASDACYTAVAGVGLHVDTTAYVFQLFLYLVVFIYEANRSC